MKVKKLTALFIGLVQLLSLSPLSVFAAEGDYKASLVAAGYFTPNGLVDLADDGVEADSLCASGTVYDPIVKRYVDTVNAADEGREYYALRLPESRRNKLTTSVGYTLETYFSLGAVDSSIQGIIGAAQSGGFDIEVNKSKKMEVYVSNGGSWVKNSGGAYPGSGLTMEANKWYHITVSVSPNNVSVYRDGALLESVDVSGYTLAFPSGDNMKDHYGLVIGGDYKPGNLPQSGSVEAMSRAGSKFAFTNIYSKALTADEVAQTYKENVTDHQANAAADALAVQTIKVAAMLGADETNEEWKTLNAEGAVLFAKADLNEADVTAYADKVNAAKEKTGGFPFGYDAKSLSLPVGVGTFSNGTADVSIAEEAAKYGITASGIWGMQKQVAIDSKYFPSLRFSLASGGTPSSYPSPAEHFKLNFANDTVNAPTMNKDGYVYEIETTSLLNGAQTIDMQFKGKDVGGEEKIFAAIRLNKTSASNPSKADVYMIDKDGNKVGETKTINVSGNSKPGDAGDLVYYKAKINMVDHTISTWSAVRMTEGGTYTEVPASDDNILIADLPFYDDSVTSFTGVTHKATTAYADGSGFRYGGGNWITKIRVDEYNPNATYSVSGATDTGVTAVTLNQSGEVKYNGEFNSEHNTVTFSAVKPGVYDIAVTYANGYEAAFGASASARVEESDVTDLKITSSLIPLNLYTVSGATDKHVTKATLNQEGQVRFIGVFNEEHTAVTFADVPDGTYDIVTEYDMNYTAADAAAKTVTVSGADVTSLAITSKAPSDGITLRVAVISDTQYGRSGDYRAKFRLAMDGVVAKAREEGNPDVLMIPGDISHNSRDDELQKFYEDLNSYLTNYQDVFADTEVLLLRGNHDAKPATSSVKGITVGQEKTTGQFVESTRKYFDPNYVADYVTEVKGYSFVMVSQDTQRSNDEPSDYPYIHSKDTVTWFTQAMAEAGRKTDRPIFVGMHPATFEKGSDGKVTAENGTVFGSYSIEGNVKTASYWSTSELYDAIKPYSNAITFAGHSHWTVANEGSIHQRDFTSLNTGAVNNMEIENCWNESFQPKRFDSSNENESNGFYITVNTDQQVNVERMDFYRMKRDNNVNAVLGADWTFNPTDKSSWTYTSDRDKTAPAFTQDAFVRVKENTLSDSGCTIEWSNTALTENESDINHFKLEIFEKDGTTPVKTYTASSYYWLGAERPTINNWTASDLVADTAYYAKLTAYDQFYNASAPLESELFTVPQRIEKPAAVTAVSFTDRTAVDTSEYARFYGLQPISCGAVPVSFNEELKMYEGVFARTAESTSDNFFKILLDEGRRKLMQNNGYTIDLMFSPTGQFQTNNNIIGAAEATGFDIELAADGKLHTYVRHNGGWVQSPHPGETLTTELGKYYHITVTYDGKNIKVYQDGVLKETRAVDNKPLEFSDKVLADSFYGMVIGGDYKPVDGGQTDAQSAFNGKIVFANIYSSAWNSGEVASSHTGLMARKNLTKIGDLNTVLTQTLPDSNVPSKDALLTEGWALMNSATLTDEQIAAYLTKAAEAQRYHNVTIYARDLDLPLGSGGDSAAISNIGSYGITNGTSGTTWSIVKHNSITSCYTDSLRFSLQTLGNVTDREFVKWTFANDTVNNPSKIHFDGEKAVFESEIALAYNGAGYIDLNLNGKNAEGVEGAFAKLRFKPDSANSQSGTVTLVDNSGQIISRAIPVQLHDSEGHARRVFYIRAEIDLENEKVSVWLVPRKAEGNPYTGTLHTEVSLLGENVDFNTNGISEFSSVSATVTNVTATNGLWINNMRVSGFEKAEVITEFTATVADAQTVLDSIKAGGETQVSVQIINPKQEEKIISLYAAAYDADGRLLHAPVPASKQVTELNDTVTATVQLPTEIAASVNNVKLFVWDENLQSYARYALK